MTRSAQELNLKLTASEQRVNELYERVQTLEYQLGEVIGTVDEYVAMPVMSLKSRMVQAVERARARLRA